MTLSDVLLTLGILLLLAEVIKGARPGAKYLTDHLLSLIVFGAAAAEFVLWPKFGTSTYFLMTALSLVDFLSGLALRTRRRAVAVAAPASPPKAPNSAEAEKSSRRARTGPAPAPRRSRCRPPPLLPNPCCRTIPNRSRCSPPSRPSRRRTPRRKSIRRAAFAGSPVTGSAVAGTAAGPALSAAAGQAGHAPALI